MGNKVVPSVRRFVVHNIKIAGERWRYVMSFANGRRWVWEHYSNGKWRRKRPPNGVISEAHHIERVYRKALMQERLKRRYGTTRNPKIKKTRQGKGYR